MPERLLKLLLVMMVAILIGVVFQERYKNQSLEDERSACVEQREKLANEARRLKQQVTQMKEQQHKTDTESRRSSAKFAALEENLEKLEDERTAWDDERDRLHIREKHLKQQHDDCRSQLKAADSATTEEKIRRLRTESDLEELKTDLLLCNVKTITQEVLLAKTQSGVFKTEEVLKIGSFGYRTYPVLVKQFKTEAALKENKLIIGVAILNEDIYIVTLCSNIIERYDSRTLSTKGMFLLQGYETLQDLQPCIEWNSLFVVAKESTGKTFILSVDPHNQEILDSWAVDSCIIKLSVTEDCHVVAACSDKKKIIEFSSTGHLLREIVLKPETGIVGPRVALKMTNGNFLVSYDGNYPYAGVGLAILNSNGDVLKSYSGSSQDSELVHAMAIDRL